MLYGKQISAESLRTGGVLGAGAFHSFSLILLPTPQLVWGEWVSLSRSEELVSKTDL